MDKCWSKKKDKKKFSFWTILMRDGDVSLVYKVTTIPGNQVQNCHHLKLTFQMQTKLILHKKNNHVRVSWSGYEHRKRISQDCDLLQSIGNLQHSERLVLLYYSKDFQLLASKWLNAAQLDSINTDRNEY